MKPEFVPDGHVTDLVLDYVQGRLSPEGVRRIEDHLAACADCAADYSLARRLAVPAAMHIDPELLVHLSEAGKSPSESQASHLAECAACREELEWLRALPPAPVAEDAAAGEPLVRPVREIRPRPRREFSWRWLIPLAAAASLALFFILRPSEDFDPQRWARPKPLPVRVLRGPEPLPAALIEGLEAYRSADYTRTDAILTPLEGNDETGFLLHLYRGSARLLLRRVTEAAADLRQAVALAPGTSDRDTARWQLVQCLLILGERDELATQLEQISREAGPHQAQAGRLLRRLRALPPSKDGAP